MKNCQHCGFENEDDAKFCVHCGEAMGDTPAQASVTQETEVTNETQQSQQTETTDETKEETIQETKAEEGLHEEANHQEKPVTPITEDTKKKVSEFVQTQKENLSNIHWHEMIDVLKNPDSETIFSKDVCWVAIIGSFIVYTLQWWIWLGGLLTYIFKKMTGSTGYAYDFGNNSAMAWIKGIRQELGINFFTYILYGAVFTLAMYISWLCVEKIVTKLSWKESSRIACTRIFMPALFTLVGILISKVSFLPGTFITSLSMLYQIIVLAKDFERYACRGYKKLFIVVMLFVVQALVGLFVYIHLGMAFMKVIMYLMYMI